MPTKSDDLLIEIACAEVMGFKYSIYGDKRCWVHDYFPVQVKPRTAPWRPLDDRGQALEIVERLKLNITNPYDKDLEPGWEVYNDGVDAELCVGMNPDLRRAICMCAAKIHYRTKEKEKK